MDLFCLHKFSLQTSLFSVVIAFFIYRAHGMQQPISEANLDLNLVKDFDGSFSQNLVNWFLNPVNKVNALQMWALISLNIE